MPKIKINENNSNTNSHAQNLVSLVALIGTSGTLVCCVIPFMIALIAGGASVANLVSVFPFIITLSQYKIYLFLFSALLIIIAIIIHYRKPACSITHREKDCKQISRIGYVLFLSSIIIWLMSFFFSYILPFFL